MLGDSTLRRSVSDYGLSATVKLERQAASAADVCSFRHTSRPDLAESVQEQLLAPADEVSPSLPLHDPGAALAVDVPYIETRVLGSAKEAVLGFCRPGSQTSYGGPSEERVVVVGRENIVNRKGLD